MLTIYHNIPDGLLDTHPKDLHRILPGPSLIFIPGQENPPLFVSTLLHGNEITGFQAVQRLLKESPILPRSLILFLGNIEATKEGQRRLSHQPDYNRIWDGGSSQEELMAQEVINVVTQENPLLAIDIHNNSGRNPFYGCINQKKRDHLALAFLFSSTIVYFTEPRNVLSVAFSKYCPTTIIECGQSGQPESEAFAYSGLRKAFGISQSQPLGSDDNYPGEYFEVVAKLVISPEVSIGHSKNQALGPHQVVLRHDLEELNFQKLIPGTFWAESQSAYHLKMIDKENRDITEEFFDWSEQRLTLKKTFVPSMLTTDETMIHQDCLGYVMLPREIEF